MHAFIRLLLPLLALLPLALSAQPAAPVVEEVELQPLRTQTRRLMDALHHRGRPLSPEQRGRIDRAGNDAYLKEVQSVLDPLCLYVVTINPESRVKTAAGPAAPRLAEKDWTQLLVKVVNQAGVTAELKVSHPEGEAVEWARIRMGNDRPLQAKLGGAGLEYRLIQVYSRAAGKHAAVLQFDVGQGTQDLGFRSDILTTFDAAPARAITLNVRDENGEKVTAGFEIRDGQRRVYPSQAARDQPDFSFHPQVYRRTGEVLRLPDGTYTVKCTRGPEYLAILRTLTVAGDASWDFDLQRWIDPSKRGWWSGDHHIHAAGCAHFTSPTEGVLPADMARHCQGEDLKIGATLTWGPGFDYQKQFFSGKEDAASEYPYLLRYDVEVSGFGSHKSGHLCLLRLKEQVHPGGDSKHHWPTFGLNTLRWAKKQGAIVGPAHSGWGLAVDTDKLPNFVIPPYDGIGANEYIVDVTHQLPGADGTPEPAVDFLSMGDTPSVWELNMWYHTLNAGFRTRISGETDFPCIYGERVGLGRAYVKIDGRLNYDDWCEGIRIGRAYVSDGRSHLIDFKVNDTEMGSGNSEVSLDAAGTVRVEALVAAWLPEQPQPGLRDRPYQHKPYWHIERARIGDGRKVAVELVINGRAVARKEITADGKSQVVRFEPELDRSSWLTLRILPSSHTNPVFVTVGGKPVRPSRKSVQWCLDGVEKCWKEKAKTYKGKERDEAKAAYEHARQEYRKRLKESKAD